MRLAVLLWWLLGGVILPAWLLCGMADFRCHAHTDIAHTSGTHESVLHLLQIGSIGVPLLAFLFLALNGFTLAVLIAGVVLHTALSVLDLTYTEPRRRIGPFEQYVHSFLNVLPWVALALVAILHWPVVTSWFGQGLAADWTPRLRTPSFDGRIIVAIIAASLLLVVLPAVIEFARTLAVARRAHLSSSSDRSFTNPL